MFYNLFKETKTNTTNLPFTNNSAIVTQIHEEFDTEVDRLLDEAKKLTEVPVNSNFKKANNLISLGFKKTKEIVDSDKKQMSVKKSISENMKKKERIEAINHFSLKYPQYKFITKESIHRICEKYGLVYSGVENYIGSVPNKNLKDMMDFKIDDKHCVYVSESIYMGRSLKRIMSHREANPEMYDNKSIEPESTYLRSMGRHNARFVDEFYDHAPRDFRVNKKNLQIAAPVKDFDTTNMELDGYELNRMIDDPVVFHPVMFRDTEYFLIITAWGDEASDELVVNEKMN